MDVEEFGEWSENESTEVGLDRIGLTGEGLGEIHLSDDDSLESLGNQSTGIFDSPGIPQRENIESSSRNNSEYTTPGAQLLERLSVGSMFSGPEDVYIQYCEYARFEGFSVRRGDQRYVGQTDKIRWKEFLCSCAGKADCKTPTTRIMKYNKLVVRTGCKVKVRVNRVAVNSWRITKMEQAHNHDLYPPEQSYMLRSSRDVTIGKQSVIDAMTSFGIGVNVACGFLERQCGGTQNLGFTRQDAYDHVKRTKRATKVKNGDAGSLMTYFINKAYEEKDFFWSLQMDDEGRIMNFFFRDSRSADDYTLFGDILSVDTTYRTNRYNLICAPFVGVNHHSFNIMYGMGFLSDETTETFEWLFTEFLKSMKGAEPKIIFSDQCVAMMNAIDKVFPNSKHRICQWHINKNATSHFGSLNGNSEFKKTWHRCMNGVETENEFEITWKTMIETYKLGDNSWFQGMYKLRHRWASVFTQHLFCAGLHATSRSEATNRVLKYLQKSSNSLYEFACNLEEIQRRWRTKEVEEDTLGIWTPGQVLPNNKLLFHAASVYTRYVYKSFEHQFIRSNNVVLVGEPVHVGYDNLEFTASTAEGARSRTILLNVQTNHATCSCRMWETDGIFCRHILRVYSVRNVFALPDSQILKRWSKRVKPDFPSATSLCTTTPALRNMVFLNNAIMDLYDMGGMAAGNDTAEQLITDRMKSLRLEICTLTNLPQSEPRRKPRCQLNSGPAWELYRDPVPIKEKGWTAPRKSRHGNIKNGNNVNPTSTTNEFSQTGGSKRKQCSKSVRENINLDPTPANNTNPCLSNF